MGRAPWAPSSRRSRFCGWKGCYEDALPDRGFCEEHAARLDKVKAELDAEAEERSYNSRVVRKRRRAAAAEADDDLDDLDDSL